MRGATDEDGKCAHLLSAMLQQTRITLAQREVDRKTNEITQVKPLLDDITLDTGEGQTVVFTADALHTQRAHATYLRETKGWHFILPVAENQPTLFAQLDALDWTKAPIAHTMTDKGHGRIERRTIQVLPAPRNLKFPHVAQVILIERAVYDLHGTQLSSVAVLCITSLTAAQASPAQIAHLVRGHWEIEDGSHHVRDVSWREDNSQVRTGNGPAVMAALRCFAIGPLHRLHQHRPRTTLGPPRLPKPTDRSRDVRTPEPCIPQGGKQMSRWQFVAATLPCHPGTSASMKRNVSPRSDNNESVMTMSKTVLAVRHVLFEDLGILASLLEERGYDIIYVDIGIDPLEPPSLMEADLVVVLGGPIGAYQTDLYPFLTDEIAAIRKRLVSGKPILGVCLGAQLIATALGAQVRPTASAEIGYGPLTLTPEGRDSTLAHVAEIPVLHWHGDEFAIPAGATRLAETPGFPNQAFIHGYLVLGLQFHLEVDHDQIERWLIGHAHELSAHQIDLAHLRQDAAAHGPTLARAARLVFGEWLDRVKEREHPRRLS